MSKIGAATTNAVWCTKGCSMTLTLLCSCQDFNFALFNPDATSNLHTLLWGSMPWNGTLDSPPIVLSLNECNAQGNDDVRGPATIDARVTIIDRVLQGSSPH